MLVAMLNLSGKRKLQAIIAILGLVISVYASASGPEARYTGAPGDINSCVQCHDTFVNPNVGPGSVAVTGMPAIYQPNQQYTLTVRVQQTGRSKFGFQLTAVDSNNNRVGTLASLDGDTQLNSDIGVGGRQYIQHSSQGTTANASNARTWQVRWTAPSTDAGTVRFFVAGNAANNDGTNQNDYIYTTAAFTESVTSNVTVAFVGTPVDGQTLNGGSSYRINWNTTGQSNIASIEVRYSTDDGATFPITNLITSTTDASTAGFDWAVPNVNSSTAKIRVQASTKNGNAINVISGKFTLQGNGSSPAPVITSAKFKGNKFDVFGTNFEIGSLIVVNDQEFATTNLDPPTEALRSKKAGKKTAAGQTVVVKVKNLNGTFSNSIEVTKPLE
jgi:hypothetical protein